MRPKFALRILAAFLIVAAILSPRTSPAAIDFAVTDLYLIWEDDSFNIYAELVVQSAAESDTYTPEMSYYLDGAFVGSNPIPIEVIEQIDCEQSQDCSPACDPIIIGYQISFGSCLAFAGDGCGCAYAYVDNSGPYPYTGQGTCTAVIDSDAVYTEMDEENNVQMIEISGVPVEPLSWTMMKALYRAE